MNSRHKNANVIAVDKKLLFLPLISSSCLFRFTPTKTLGLTDIDALGAHGKLRPIVVEVDIITLDALLMYQQRTGSHTASAKLRTKFTTVVNSGNTPYPLTPFPQPLQLEVSQRALGHSQRAQSLCLASSEESLTSDLLYWHSRRK